METKCIMQIIRSLTFSRATLMLLLLQVDAKKARAMGIQREGGQIVERGREIQIVLVLGVGKWGVTA